MGNAFINALKEEANMTTTFNGAPTYRSTQDGLLDLFGMGGAYRNRSADDCIFLFKKAYDENPTYAMKCLFYLRDILAGQGERRFFRVIIQWLAFEHPEAIRRNLQYIPLLGRWDDMYAFVGTPVEEDAFVMMRNQIELDCECKTPSLLAKWLKSENASSKETRRLGDLTRRWFHLSHREYRKLLSHLRQRINIVERLMSENRWDEIEFDKIPSKAGMIYRNAFARHDVERMKSQKDVISYADFAKSETTKVNAKALYPYDVVKEAVHYMRNISNREDLHNTDRLMINKYWDNLTDYFNGCSLNGICVVDTSGSMIGDPLWVAVSLGMYCAERNSGSYANHFFTFSTTPEFRKVEGLDFVDKVHRLISAKWGFTTNIEAVFDKMLAIAQENGCSQDEIPENVIVISDMEFDRCVANNQNYRANSTVFEIIEAKWNAAGYQLPHVVFWNVNAMQSNIPMRPSKYVSFVSGFSPSLFEQIMSGKTATDLMYDKLNSKRYEGIY